MSECQISLGFVGANPKSFIYYLQNLKISKTAASFWRHNSEKKIRPFSSLVRQAWQLPAPLGDLSNRLPSHYQNCPIVFPFLLIYYFRGFSVPASFSPPLFC